MVRAFGLGTEAHSWLTNDSSHAVDSAQAHSSAANAFISTTVPLKIRTQKQVSSFHEEAKEGDEEEEKKGGACFPAEAKVYVSGRGPVPIADIKAGDRLLAGDANQGNLYFSPFLGHLHIEESAMCDCIELTFSNGTSLLVSQEHLVFVAGSADDQFVGIKACEAKAGEVVSRVGLDGIVNKAVIMKATAGVLKKGRYSPLTRAGTVVVDGTLCSCYANPFSSNMTSWWQRVMTHEGMHQSMFPLFLAHDLGLDKAAMTAAAAAAAVAAKSLPRVKIGEGIHPYCRALLALPVPSLA